MMQTVASKLVLVFLFSAFLFLRIPNAVLAADAAATVEDAGAKAAETNADDRLDQIAKEMEESLNRISALRSGYQARHKALFQKRVEVESKDREIAALKERVAALESELVKLRGEIQKRLDTAPDYKEALSEFESVQSEIQALHLKVQELRKERIQLELQRAQSDPAQPSAAEMED